MCARQEEKPLVVKGGLTIAENLSSGVTEIPTYVTGPRQAFRAEFTGCLTLEAAVMEPGRTKCGWPMLSHDKIMAH